MISANHLILCAIFLPVWVILYYTIPYLTTYRPLTSIPGPSFNKLSNIPLALSARRGKKFAYIHNLHHQYGPIVRVGYNHISIASERALNVVYGHGNGFLKDDFYEAFVSGVPGVFSTRDRAQHARKRRIVAHAFAEREVVRFERFVEQNLGRWVKQLDRIAACGKGVVNMMPWCTFVAFDIIGDLAFGLPFGMVEKGRDECEMRIREDGPVVLASGAESLNRRGEVSSTLGLLPALRPWAKWLPDPFFSKGLQAVSNMHGIAETSVAKRLDGNNDSGSKQRNDILDLLIRSKGDDGNPMQRDELVSEALTQLIAGSDTVSNTACAVIYWILHGERAAPGTILPRLQAELDAAIPKDQDISTHPQVKNLPLLRRCIDEGMRLHSTSAIGLPRIVTSSCGVTFDNKLFPYGTVLSVPSYTLHHDASIWGPDVEDFKPDRWLPENLTQQQNMAFNSFSYGPRACVGRNVAIMELQMIVGTFFRRFDVKLHQEELISHEGFSKKPEECWVGIKRR